jgi:arylsulfatase A-like enzyme
VVVPRQFPNAPLVRNNLLSYYAAVRRMDEQIGTAIDRLQKLNLLDDTLVIYTSDNGWQMPRGLANCYDTGTRIPLAMRWPRMLKSGRRIDEFVSLTDLGPTLLQLTGLPPLPGATGQSFFDILQGRHGASPRDAVFLERERHANVRRGDLSYPIRGIRTRHYLYLRNLRPDRWPAGDPQRHWAVGDFGDVDNSTTKAYILEHRGQPEVERFYELSFAHRPAEELYDLTTDPDQLVNVADQPNSNCESALTVGCVTRPILASIRRATPGTSIPISARLRRQSLR